MFVKNVLVCTIIVDHADGTELARCYKIHDLKAYFADCTNFGTSFNIGQRLEPRFSPKDNCHVDF